MQSKCQYKLPIKSKFIIQNRTISQLRKKRNHRLSSRNTCRKVGPVTRLMNFMVMAWLGGVMIEMADMSRDTGNNINEERIPSLINILQS